jgi:hypothetical protein
VAAQLAASQEGLSSSKPGHVVANDCIIVNSESKWMRKEVFVAQFKNVSLQFSG